jgi:hypothetical protein
MFIKCVTERKPKSCLSVACNIMYGLFVSITEEQANEQVDFLNIKF